MLTKRIIPCLDIKDGRTVKGVNFIELRDAGDPVALAKKYAIEGADELIFLDISATEEKRKTLVTLVEKIARAIDIPFTVGGGVQTVEDARLILKAGADKISVNSAAINNPQLISQLSTEFGAQCVVLAIDAKMEESQWVVYASGGKIRTELNLFQWAELGEKLGAGEILFTSMNGDGTKNGYSLDPLQKLTERLNIPVIASGGAGKSNDFIEVFQKTNVDAALAASVFHFGEISIPDLKNELMKNEISVRYAD